jgi:hypothetical protein
MRMKTVLYGNWKDAEKAEQNGVPARFLSTVRLAYQTGNEL